MDNIPSDLVEAVQGLAAEGVPVEQIAFMTHASISLVREILAQSNTNESVNTTSERK